MMNEGSVDNNECDANGSTVATSITKYSDDAPLGHTMISALAEVDQTLTENSVAHDGSQHGDSKEDQKSMEEDGESQLDNPLVARTLISQEGKHRVTTGHTIQPGAIAMAGVNEGNNSNSSGQENPTSNSGDFRNEANTEAMATVTMGLDQGDAASPTTISKHNVTTECQCDNGKADVKFADYPEEDNPCSALVEAELVMPPIEAVRVSIDEDPSTVGNHIYPLELEHTPSRQNTHGTRSKRLGPTFWVLLSLLIVIVVCATLIPYALNRNDDSDVGSKSPTSPNPNGCFTSLLDILNAQISDEDVEGPTYIICPNTTIKIGTMNNPAENDYRYVNGDYPIMVTRENVTIQCGWDGRRDNNCVIDAGFMHVLTLQVIAMPDGSGYSLNRTSDNLLIRGITFTGIPINVGPFRGSSVSLSHPGKNMRFEDCLWYNITAQSGLIGAYRNYYQVLVDLPLEDQSIEVTFADCVFHNIVYDSPLIFIRNQAIRLERCVFRDIKLSFLVEEYCRYYSGVTDEVVETNQGCATLLHCASQSDCSMKDICVHGIQIKGQGIVVIHDDTTFKHEGLYLERNSTATTCELAILSAVNDTNFTCRNIFDEPSCPLLPGLYNDY